ncbi:MULTISPECIES: PdaC/SigV domain-containing protein [Asticcacaulis]|uniref:PdaC/SigV domain-containing protein n=1 Tax=Asticcacaulis TaxID=76890 RepID=UPI001AE7A109|nr:MULTISPECIES: DUF4163 domain-containing protein [Asticcacaulis]MBP2160624.1 hypothetical protein [Asticcacaulis solisilvae]MDR6801669.1 hypothetical protein [Asticcacaulis sp. BE141]
MGNRLTIARLSLVALALLGMASCDNKPKTEKTKSGDKPLTVAPLGFAKADADAEVRLTLPEAIRAHPELHTQLYTTGERKLKEFVTSAHTARTDQAAEGIEVPTYFHSINWKIAAQNPRLLSLYAEEDDFQGGAHPNSTFEALLWDKSSKELINTARLFTTGADLTAANAYVCQQIEIERSRRVGEPTTQAASGFTCPKLADSRLILIPSTVNGKFGAIDVLFAPYEVAPYAEGPYVIRVPQSVVRGQLNPEFADQFAGEAAKEAPPVASESAAEAAPEE